MRRHALFALTVAAALLAAGASARPDPRGPPPPRGGAGAGDAPTDRPHGPRGRPDAAAAPRETAAPAGGDAGASQQPRQMAAQSAPLSSGGFMESATSPGTPSRGRTPPSGSSKAAPTDGGPLTTRPAAATPPVVDEPPPMNPNTPKCATERPDGRVGYTVSQLAGVACAREAAGIPDPAAAAAATPRRVRGWRRESGWGRRGEPSRGGARGPRRPRPPSSSLFPQEPRGGVAADVLTAGVGSRAPDGGDRGRGGMQVAVDEAAGGNGVRSSAPPFDAGGGVDGTATGPLDVAPDAGTEGAGAGRRPPPVGRDGLAHDPVSDLNRAVQGAQQLERAITESPLAQAAAGLAGLAQGVAGAVGALNGRRLLQAPPALPPLAPPPAASLARASPTAAPVPLLASPLAALAARLGAALGLAEP